MNNDAQRVGFSNFQYQQNKRDVFNALDLIKKIAKRDSGRTNGIKTLKNRLQALIVDIELNSKGIKGNLKKKVEKIKAEYLAEVEVKK